MLVVVLVLMAGCRRERTHPRLAELTSPFLVTVRTVDAPRSCDGLTGVDKATCTASPGREGCTFVAVGSNADLPLAYTGPMRKEHCDEQRTRSHTVMLAEQPLKSARLFIDERGERVFVDVETDGWVLFVRDGKLLTSRQLWDDRVSAPLRPVLADGSPDWPAVPTLLATWEPTAGLLSGLTLADVMKDDPDPQENLVLALAGSSYRYDAVGFAEAWALLDQPHRDRALRAALDQVKAGEDLSSWFRTRDDFLPQYRRALLSALEHGQLTQPTQLNDVAEADPVALQSAACGLIETAYLGAAPAEWDEPPPVALALIAKKKLKCPWVLSWLERRTCDLSLCCQAEDAAFDPEHRWGLCTQQQLDAAVTGAFREAPLDELITGDGFDLDEHPGELLLAAAAAQGPLPADFVKRTARRSYAGQAPPECTGLPRPVGDWACGLPATLTASSQEQCRLRIDDAAKQLAFDTLPKPVRPTP